MASMVDIRLVELICSRLCHELVNPIGAVGNGVELLTEIGGGMDKEALGLISQSAKTAGQRLQFYRIAYGQASGLASEISLAQAGELVGDILASHRLRLDWPSSGPEGERRLGKSTLKLLLNLTLLAAEALPRGGRVGLAILPGEAGEASILAEGDPAGLSEAARSAFEGTTELDNLTPRTAHAYFTGRLAAELGLAVTLVEAPGRVTLRLRLPTVS
jgi:histidine phosphotransferase ChpT